MPLTDMRFPSKHSYLPVVTGIISEADYVFCPESPPPQDWPERLCNKLIQASEIRHTSHMPFNFRDQLIFHTHFMLTIFDLRMKNKKRSKFTDLTQLSQLVQHGLKQKLV